MKKKCDNNSETAAAKRLSSIALSVKERRRQRQRRSSMKKSGVPNKKLSITFATASPMLRIVSPRKIAIKPILRVARRLSAKARRTLSLSRSSLTTEISDYVRRNTKNIVRFRTSPKYRSITPLPDKPVGRIRMPYSPTDPDEEDVQIIADRQPGSNDSQQNSVVQQLQFIEVTSSVPIAPVTVEPETVLDETLLLEEFEDLPFTDNKSTTAHKNAEPERSGHRESTGARRRSFLEAQIKLREHAPVNANVGRRRRSISQSAALDLCRKNSIEYEQLQRQKDDNDKLTEKLFPIFCEKPAKKAKVDSGVQVATFTQIRLEKPASKSILKTSDLSTSSTNSGTSQRITRSQSRERDKLQPVIVDLSPEQKPKSSDASAAIAPTRSIYSYCKRNRTDALKTATVERNKTETTEVNSNNQRDADRTEAPPTDERFYSIFQRTNNQEQKLTTDPAPQKRPNSKHSPLDKISDSDSSKKADKPLRQKKLFADNVGQTDKLQQQLDENPKRRLRSRRAPAKKYDDVTDNVDQLSDILVENTAVNVDKETKKESTTADRKRAIRKQKVANKQPSVLDGEVKENLGVNVVFIEDDTKDEMTFTEATIRIPSNPKQDDNMAVGSRSEIDWAPYLGLVDVGRSKSVDLVKPVTFRGNELLMNSESPVTVCSSSIYNLNEMTQQLTAQRSVSRDYVIAKRESVDSDRNNSPDLFELETDQNPSSSNDNHSLPWTELYRPRSSAEFVGNSESVDSLKQWLTKCCQELQAGSRSERNGPKKSTRSKKHNDSYSDSDDDSNTRLNMAVIYGCSGVGKTCLVYALAEELGFKVIESNCSSKRNKQNVISLEGATTTRRICVSDSMSNSPLGAFFGSVKPTSQTSVSHQRAMSILLFDDVDILFDSDENFWSGIRELSAKTLTPIILTCSDYDSAETINSLLPEGDVHLFQLQPLSASVIANRLSTVLQREGCKIDREDLLTEYCRSYRGDLRAALNGLEFEVRSTSMCCLHDRSSSSETEAVTLAELRLIRDRLNPSPLRSTWLAKELDGLQDRPRNLDVNLNRERIEEAFNELIVDSNGDVNAEKNVCEIMEYWNNCTGSTVNRLSPGRIVLDYLPYLRTMALIQSGRVAGRKLRHYFIRIGLESRVGAFRSILEKTSAFR